MGMSDEMVDFVGFVSLAKLASGGDCFVMIDFAKPKSGGFVFVDRVGALCVPSGVSLCTSERIGRQCVAYAIDSPALRFRGTSLVACHEYSYERAPP